MRERPAERLEEAEEIKPPVTVERPVTRNVPEAYTLPNALTENRPSGLAVDVATKKLFAVSVEVVVPSVTWKMLVPEIRPSNAPPASTPHARTPEASVSIVLQLTRPGKVMVPEADRFPEEST